MSELTIKDKFAYLLSDAKYYETLTRYAAKEDDFYIGLRRRKPSDWTLHRHESWTHCMPPKADFPDQGWKIHVSATPAHAAAILVTVASVLFEENVAFKFLTDKLLLTLSLSKRWSRGGSGKFMAIYPRDADQCGLLLEKLYRATIGFNGPYILSDRRYRDSRVIYYRYGGLRSIHQMGADGTNTLMIKGADGQYIQDERTPFFQLPEGIEDPFLPPVTPAEEADTDPGTLKEGRYEILKAMTFSNSGGVYLALDHHQGRQVIIKEARPYTNVSLRGLDAVQLLKKEHRVLTCLRGAGIAPEPLDFFFDWEHAYLVEEFFDGGRDFREYMASISLTLRTRATRVDAQAFMDNYLRLFSCLATFISKLHEKNIVFGDLSMGNILVFGTPGSDDFGIKLIDFEGAHEINVDIAAHLFTPGFSSSEFDERGVTNKEDDLYALGALMLAGLFPMNQLLVLDRQAGHRFMEAISKDFGVPQTVCEMIEGLLSKEGFKPPLEKVIETLNAEFQMPQPAIRTGEFDDLNGHEVLDEVMRYIASTPDFDRTDRLFPADPEVFTSNPLSLAHGACGVALVQHTVTGKVDQNVLDWTDQFPISSEKFAPGLYSGMAGIAWFWILRNEFEKARSILAKCEALPITMVSADMYYGAAGIGMALLKFHQETSDPTALQGAIRYGEHILTLSEVTDDGRRSWRTPIGLAAGFGHGAAGISTFLLYLYQVTHRTDFLSAGQQGLAWVAGEGLTNLDGGLTWAAKDNTPSVTPYWRWGSSGVGRALVRYWLVTGDDVYAAMIDKILIDCDRKYAIFPGYFFGLAGIGEFCLDLMRIGRWKDQAEACLRRLLSGCMLFALPKAAGIAFPGETLSRISCDLGTGSAGLALVLHRYLSRSGACLMLDEVIPGWSETISETEAA